MFLELLIGYWAFKPLAEEIERYDCEQEIMLYEIRKLKEEIENLKNNKNQNVKK